MKRSFNSELVGLKKSTNPLSETTRLFIFEVIEDALEYAFISGFVQYLTLSDIFEKNQLALVEKTYARYLNFY
jgi:hypothetical protein